jgi:hypothetical protein
MRAARPLSLTRLPKGFTSGPKIDTNTIRPGALTQKDRGLNRDPLDLVEHDLIALAVVKLGRAADSRARPWVSSTIIPSPTPMRANE